MNKAKNGFTVVEIIVVLIIIGLIATIGWLVYDRNFNTTSDQPSSQSISRDKTESNMPDDLASYSNEEMNLQFTHPKNWGEVVVNDYVKSNCDKNIQDFESQNPGVQVTYSGKIYEVTFTENSSKKLFAITKDYGMSLPLPCQFMIQLPDIKSKIVKTVDTSGSHTFVVSSDAFEAGVYNYYNFGISDINHSEFRDGTIYTQLSEARSVSEISNEENEIDSTVANQMGLSIDNADKQFVTSIKELDSSN